jgi:hypothetical protein
MSRFWLKNRKNFIRDFFLLIQNSYTCVYIYPKPFRNQNNGNLIFDQTVIIPNLIGIEGALISAFLLYQLKSRFT